jgi:DNA-binding XRE family transcriptional regulator
VRLLNKVKKNKRRNELIKTRKSAGEKGYTQKEVAKAIGISLVSYWRIENGFADPRNEIVKRICRLLGCKSEVF